MSDTVYDQALMLLFKIICSTCLKKFVQGRKKIIYSLRGCVRGVGYAPILVHTDLYIFPLASQRYTASQRAQMPWATSSFDLLQTSPPQESAKPS